jgi:hypothetical protein
MSTKYCFQISSPMPTCSSDVHFTKTWIPTQPIHILVDYSNLLFNTKTIFLKNENPFYRPPCELLDSMKCLNGWWSTTKVFMCYQTNNTKMWPWPKLTTKHSPSHELYLAFVWLLDQLSSKWWPCSSAETKHNDVINVILGKIQAYKNPIHCPLAF